MIDDVLEEHPKKPEFSLNCDQKETQTDIHRLSMTIIVTVRLFQVGREYCTKTSWLLVNGSTNAFAMSMKVTSTWLRNPNWSRVYEISSTAPVTVERPKPRWTGNKVDFIVLSYIGKTENSNNLPIDGEPEIGW